jgi:hypothetical protein
MKQLTALCVALAIFVSAWTPLPALARSESETLAGSYTTRVVSENSAYNGEWTLTLTRGGRITIIGKLNGTLTREYSGRYVAQGSKITLQTTLCPCVATYTWRVAGAKLTLGGVDSSCAREFILNNVWRKVEFAGIAS